MKTFLGLLDANFIYKVRYSKWISNAVLVKKALGARQMWGSHPNGNNNNKGSHEVVWDDNDFEQVHFKVNTTNSPYSHTIEEISGFWLYPKVPTNHHVPKEGDT